MAMTFGYRIGSHSKLVIRPSSDGRGNTAKHSEPGKDEADHLLQTSIGVETKPDFAVPDVAEGNRYPQFPPTGFRPSRIKHPGPQHAQLNFTDAALHTRKKPVVRPTGVIDTVQINNADFDKPAQFEQMVPVSAVPSEPRGIKAQNSPHLVGT